MNMFVLMKRTFDTEEKIIIKDGRISEEDAEFIINPYDEYAIEEAISLRERHGGHVTVISVGKEETEQQLRAALAMGADSAVLIDCEDIGQVDQTTTARLLAAYLKEQQFDLILAGNVAIDGGSGQVGPRVAEMLGIPQATTVIQIEIQERTAVLTRDVEGDEETMNASLPLLITAQQGLNEPRYPTLPGIMKAKKKPLHILDLDDLGLEDKEIEARTRTIEYSLPPAKKAGKRFDGDPPNNVKKLISLLKTEAKVL